MNTQDLTHNDLPKAIGYLIREVYRLREDVVTLSNHEPPKPDVMNTAEAAEFLKMKKSTLYAHIKNIPHTKVGSKTLFSRKRLEKWLDDKRVMTLDEEYEIRNARAAKLVRKDRKPKDTTL